jgi:hypothetical protein
MDITDVILNMIVNITESPTVLSKIKRTHEMMRFVMSSIDTNRNLLDLLLDKLDHCGHRGLSEQSVHEYRRFFKTTLSRKVD